MYAKLKDNKLMKFEGKLLNYTITTDGMDYRVSSINPTEEELNMAGYFSVVADKTKLDDENTLYKLSGTTIVPMEGNEGEVTDEKADIQ